MEESSPGGFPWVWTVRGGEGKEWDGMGWDGIKRGGGSLFLDFAMLCVCVKCLCLSEVSRRFYFGRFWFKLSISLSLGIDGFWVE